MILRQQGYASPCIQTTQEKEFMAESKTPTGNDPDTVYVGLTSDQLHTIYTALVLAQADESLIELIRIYELQANDA